MLQDDCLLQEDKLLRAAVSCYGDDRIDWQMVEQQVQKPAKSCRLRSAVSLDIDRLNSFFHNEAGKIVVKVFT